MFGKKETRQFKYPGMRMALDGNSAVIMCEREAADAAGAYPITPSTQMGEMWAEETAKGHVNVSDRALIFIEPESEHAAAAVTAGMSMSGLRATNFSSAQGIAFMHESLYAAAGKRLPYVLNIGCRAITKASLNVHCAHDDYHCIDDTGFTQVFAKDVQGSADLNLISRKIAELALTPAAVAQDGFLTTHLIEPALIPEREMIKAFLGSPDDIIDCPTAAQKMIYGETRRRVPALWDVDNPMSSGSVQNQDAYMQTVAAQRPFFYQHIPAITDQVMEEFYQLTGRQYARISGYQHEDAEYLIIGMGSMIVEAEAVADYLRETRKLKVGVIDITMFRPFPGDLLGKLLQGKKGVTVLERTDQPLAEDLPLMREVRSCIGKCFENGRRENELAYPSYAKYKNLKDAPSLFSGAYGLGSRDLQPEALVAAYENMLPEGTQKHFFYLGIDFVREGATPKQELHIQKIIDSYPEIKDMSLHGSENPNLMPDSSITVRMHSIGGWGAITTGKNLAMTLYDLLGYEIKANPKYGSEKKGQPTTYYMAAAPERIRINCEYKYVDVVMSPDPNVFGHSNPLAGLKPGGVFIIQSDRGSEQEVWNSFPRPAQQFIVDNDIKVFYIDGFKIARDEASNEELQLRMQGNAFQGAFFAASPVMEMSGMDETKLFAAIETQLNAKFGNKGKRIVADNLRVVHRGFSETHEITCKEIGQTQIVLMQEKKNRKSTLPLMLKQLPVSEEKNSDIHRFWEQTGSFYAAGQGSDNLADPFQAMSVMPASSGLFRDMTQIRFEYPEWVAEKCTACGDCYSVCPDSAIPGLVNTIGEVFDTVIHRIETKGTPTQFLRRETRKVEKRLRELVNEAGDNANISRQLDQAVLETIAESELFGSARTRLENEFSLFMQAIDGFQFSATKPYWSTREKQKKVPGLFSITVNPYTCKGCMECVEVCKDGALLEKKQTTESVERLRKDWAFWLELPTTNKDFIRIDDLDEKIGALDTLLLDKHNYGSMVCGDGACFGCGEKSVIHLFTSTVSASMQPRIKKHLEKLDRLIQQLDQHIRLKLISGVDLTNVHAINQTVASHFNSDLTLSSLSEDLDQGHEKTLIDQAWLGRATKLLNQLRDLKWRYVEGPSKRGRSDMGVINSTGCTSVWGSTFPYNPYPFPWTSHLFQDSPSVAMGVFEGHMAKMADGFKTIRSVELELAGQYQSDEHDAFLQQFSWKDFSDEEWHLCPPVVSIGGDGAMYDIGFQNLSRAMASGMPIKVLVLDTQVYSNTGGQACTSGFIGQVSDMAPFGKAMHGKQEMRKEMSIIGMAHRTSYVLQGSLANITHLIEGFIDGLNSRRPALFNIYAVCQPEHGVSDNATARQSKLATESRAYPLMKFNPDNGETIEECLDLEGNPSLDDDWPQYTLSYTDEDGGEGKLELPLTFADFAATEGRFRKQFKIASVETWNEKMLALHEFLELDADGREGLFPFIWGVDKDNHLTRILCSQEMVLSVEERRHFWHQLKGMAGELNKIDVNTIIDQTKQDMAQKLSSTLLSLVSSGGIDNLGDAHISKGIKSRSNDRTDTTGINPPAGKSCTVAYEPVWIETPECTACDECTSINNKIFAYNDDKHAIVINPKGGQYRDIVKAAEKCTAGCLHPGTPWDCSDKDIDKWIQRAAKYQ